MTRFLAAASLVGLIAAGAVLLFAGDALARLGALIPGDYEKVN